MGGAQQPRGGCCALGEQAAAPLRPLAQAQRMRPRWPHLCAVCQPAAVGRVHHPHQAVSRLEIVAPVGAQRLLAAHIPHVQAVAAGGTQKVRIRGASGTAAAGERWLQSASPASQARAKGGHTMAAAVGGPSALRQSCAASVGSEMASSCALKHCSSSTAAGTAPGRPQILVIPVLLNSF